MSTLRERAAGYLREGPGGVNLEKLAVYGGLLLVGYFAFKAYRAGVALKRAAAAIGTGAANVLEWIKPFDIGDMNYFTVQFPDGSTHSVGSRAVKSDGTFTVPTTLTDSNGKNPYLAVADIPGLRGTYRLAINRKIVSGINKFAIRV